MTPLLDARGVAIAGRLRPSDLAIQAGELVALAGPNGGGKTSLLRAVAQVEGSDGAVRVGGEELAGLAPNRRARMVGLLPASRDMAWPISVRDLVNLGLDGHAPKRVNDALYKMELADMAARRVDQLSTGERSRALIARMLAAAPRLLLLDEPLANLDPYWMRRVIDLLRELLAERRTAALVSLHDLSQLTRFDRVVAIHGGSIAFEGTPDSFLKSNQFVQIFRIEAEALGLSSPADRRSSP